MSPGAADLREALKDPLTLLQTFAIPDSLCDFSVLDQPHLLGKNHIGL